MNYFAEHRRALMNRLPDGLILLAGGTEIERNREVNFIFRQNSNFLYLTGVEEPGCYLLIDPKRRSSMLFLPPIDIHHRIWDGHVPGPKEARSLFGIPKTAYSDALPEVLRKAKRSYRKLYANTRAFEQFKRELRGLPNHLEQLEDALDELRVVKDSEELRFMSIATRVSSAAHRKVMAAARPGMYEYAVQAIFESECHKAGLKHLAYPSIVASGTNSAVLHYCRNDARLKAGDLLEIDAGAECRGYAADITRTFPVSRRFTQRQKDVYSIVLETQKAVIDRARSGVNWAEVHVFSMMMIAEGLKSLRVLNGSTPGLVEGGAVRLFYPHGVGHLLGLDTHDGQGGLKRKLPNPTKVPLRFVTKLEPGFVITAEPGIYFNEAPLELPELRAKYRGSINFSVVEKFLDFGGVRIEDDILVQPEGPPKVLTDVPKEIAEVEDVRNACA